MELAISILHVLVCIFLVLTILLQAGKGASVGAAFGGAGSQTVFGGRGAQTFLSKLTTAAAAVFFLTSLALSYASTANSGRSVLEGEVAAIAPLQRGLLVTVACAGAELRARVTPDAREALALEPGRRVAVLLKATAPQVLLREAR